MASVLGWPRRTGQGARVLPASPECARCSVQPPPAQRRLRAHVRAALPLAHRQTCAGRRRCEEGAHSGIRVVCSAGCAVRGMSAAPRRAAAAATARWQWAAMKGAPLPGACSCEVGVREAAASVLGPSMSLGRGAPACQRRQSVRSARCWELVHLGALDDGSATHLLRHTGGRTSARRSAPTHPTAPIPQAHLRHALAASTGRGAPDRPPVSES